MTLLVIAGSALVYTLGGHLAWSAAGGFQWPNHSADCQDFVVRTNPSDPNAPFTRYRDKVELVSEHGHWRHWRKK